MLIRITSDSTCDLNRSWLEAHNVRISPLYTIKNGEPFRDDGKEIVPADIFAHVAAGGDLCSTAACNVEDYTALFGEVLAQCDVVIHVNISAEFSSCHQNARIAAEEFPGRAFVVDSRNLSTGHGLVVCEAVRMAENGSFSPEEIVTALNDLTGRVEASFILDRLDYMVKGGRCSMVAALGANLMKLKPCIEVKDGKMAVVKKYRGSFEKCILDYTRERLAGREDLDLRQIFVTHTPVAEGIVDKVCTTIRDNAQFEKITETQAGCTIACHCGPGCLGVLFIRSK